MNSVIRTERLTLRSMRAEDTDRIIDLLSNSIIAQNYMLPDFACRADALPLAQRMIALSENDGRVVVGIDLGGEIIGWINDTGIEGKSVEVGYIIDPAHHSRGYCSEALRALIGDLFARGFERVFAGAFDHNTASLRVMEKCGMVPMELTEELDYRGRTHTVLYREIRKN